MLICLLSPWWGEGEVELIDTVLINWLRFILKHLYCFLFLFFIFLIRRETHTGQKLVRVEMWQNSPLGRIVMIPTSWDQNVSVSMQRFIEKNKPIQETPQHLCVSVDVRNNDKVKYWSGEGYFWSGIFQEKTPHAGYPLFYTINKWFKRFLLITGVTIKGTRNLWYKSRHLTVVLVVNTIYAFSGGLWGHERWRHSICSNGYSNFLYPRFPVDGPAYDYYICLPVSG